MRRFELHRVEDKTGISGTGLIAEGVAFTDGTATIRWRTKYRSTGFYSNMKELEAIHGHGGTTKIVWLDKKPAARRKPAAKKAAPRQHKPGLKKAAPRRRVIL